MKRRDWTEVRPDPASGVSHRAGLGFPLETVDDTEEFQQHRDVLRGSLKVRAFRGLHSFSFF